MSIIVNKMLQTKFINWVDKLIQKRIKQINYLIEKIQIIRQIK